MPLLIGWFRIPSITLSTLVMWGFVEDLGFRLDDCYRLLKQKQDHEDNLRGLNGLSGNIPIDSSDGVGVVFYDGELCHTRRPVQIRLARSG